MPARVLLTGVGGFIGGHVLEHLLTNTDWDVVGIDSFRHKGVVERIVDSEHYQRHRDRVTIHSHDLTAPISGILEHRLGTFDHILNVASDSHVDRSIEDPVRFVENNVALVLNMLEYARRSKPKTFIQFSTDEVFGPMYGDVAHAEWEPHIPSNPYAASKSAQESIAISYWRTFSVPVVITHTMNVLGERQDPEKFLPKVIRAVASGDEVTIHASKDGVPGSRFYIHARNVGDALVYILRSLPAHRYGDAGTDRPDCYNVVGEKRIDNLSLARLVASFVGKPLRHKLVDFHSSRPGHDLHYGLDGRKLAGLGWAQPKTLEESLERTVHWYMAHPEWLRL